MGYSSGSVITEISFEFNGWGTDYNANKQLIKIGNTSFSEFPNTQTNQ